MMRTYIGVALLPVAVLFSVDFLCLDFRESAKGGIKKYAIYSEFCF